MACDPLLQDIKGVLKMRDIACIVVLFLALPAYSQNAKVVQLTDTDAREAKTAFEQFKAAEKHWNEVQAKVKRTYKGFDSGFEFSSDFQFIVPQAEEAMCSTDRNYWVTPVACCSSIMLGNSSNGITNIPN